ncbi:COG1470 family protein [Arthrobacter sp. C152]
MHNQDGQPRRRKRTGIKASLIALVLLLASAGALIAAASSPKPGITVQVSPASQSVQQGQQAAYTVTLTSTGGFSGNVGLSVAGLPAGASGAFSPSSVTLASGATATATLTATTAATTPAGTSSLTITATSGKVSGSTTASLTVNYKISSNFSMTATPDSVTVPPGATAVYTVQLARNNFSGAVSFSVLGGLPSGATATFSPNPTTGNTATLQVATTAASPNGTSSLYLVGSGKDSTGKTQYAYANVQLVLDSTIKQFTLSGNLPGALSPGTSAGLDLQIGNATGKPLSVTNLSVAIAGVTRTSDAVARNLACTAADFTVAQYSGPYPLAVPAGSTSLSQLKITESAWPRVAMVDASNNQDGCKGATLQLTYSGSGQGN